MPFDLGDTVRLTADCTDPGGVLTTASTAVLTITLPDGTTATPTVLAPGITGQYAVDYVTAQAGRHAVRWQFTTPACAYTDAFNVREAVPPMLFSLQDAKVHLRQTETTDNDDAIRSWTESMTLCVESLVGICVPRTMTETHRIQPSGVTELVLRHTPVLSVTSVTNIATGTAAYDPAALDVDEFGILTRLDGTRLTGRLRIALTAGRRIIGANIRDGGVLILQHLWRTKMGGSRSLVGIGGTEDYAVTEPIPGFGYAIPNRALQLLEPDRLPPEGG